MSKIYYYELYFEPEDKFQAIGDNFSLFVRTTKKIPGIVKNKPGKNKTIDYVEKLVKKEKNDAGLGTDKWHLVWINPLTKESLLTWVDAPEETIDLDPRISKHTNKK